MARAASTGEPPTRLLTGTSGFAYKAWRGSFYPEDLPERRFLESYAERLRAVEINNTFYRLPNEKLLDGWRQRTPESFRFALKASRRITHQKRLVDCEDVLDYLWTTAQVLGERLGPILFQLPPYQRLDLDRLRGFLEIIPDGCRAAFEFRHPSWFEAGTFDALRDAGAALCVADTDEEKTTAPFEQTTDWGYLRLRRSAYDAAELDAWRRRLETSGWKQVFVFFKHEDAGTGPRLAQQLAEMAESEQRLRR